MWWRCFLAYRIPFLLHQDWTRFRVEQLEARLLSLDSLCGSWLSEAAQREEELHRDQLTHLLQDSINQVRKLLRKSHSLEIFLNLCLVVVVVDL